MPPTSPPPTRSRRRVALAALVAAPLLAIALVSLAPTAEALPRQCDDPGATLCEPPEPPEPPEPTEPLPPPTTTDPEPPPPPPPSTSPIVARILDQAEGGLGALTAERLWVPIKVLGQSSALVPGGGVSIWDPIPAGTASLGSDGRFTFDALSQPAGTEVVFRVTEAGQPGPVCRTRKLGSQPPADTRLRILAAPPMTISAAQLDGMVDDFVGPVTGLDPGIEATITGASLAPSADGVVLSLQGTIAVPVFGLTFDFDADQLVTLTPSHSLELGTTLIVRAAGLPTLDLDYTGPPRPDEAQIEASATPEIARRIRDAVARQAPGVVNSSVATLPAVKWWTSQQFSLSIRSVQTSTAGLVVHPALCRMG